MITQYPQRTSIGGGSLGSGDLTMDAWGVQKVSTVYSLFHGMFTYDVPLSMWRLYEGSTEVNTSVNITSTGGAARIRANGAATDTRIETTACPRYQPNRGHLYSTAAWFPSKTTAGTRDFGLFTTDNGVFFRLKSDGKLYAVIRKNTVETHEQEINTSGLTGFDVEKNNIYDIQFQWRSAGNYKFYIGDPGTGTSKLVHSINLLGTLSGTSIDNPALPACYHVKNSGGSDLSIYTACCDISSENGSPREMWQFHSAYATNVTVNGTNVPVITIYNPATIGGKVNTRGIDICRVAMSCSKKATFKVYTTRDPSAITGATLQRIDAGSFVYCDSPDTVAGAVRATAFDIAKGMFTTALQVEATNREVWENPNKEALALEIIRGEYLVILCTATTAVAEIVIEWGEQV